MSRSFSKGFSICPGRLSFLVRRLPHSPVIPSSVFARRKLFKCFTFNDVMLNHLPNVAILTMVEVEKGFNGTYLTQFQTSFFDFERVLSGPTLFFMLSQYNSLFHLTSMKAKKGRQVA